MSDTVKISRLTKRCLQPTCVAIPVGIETFENDDEPYMPMQKQLYIQGNMGAYHRQNDMACGRIVQIIN